MTFDPFEDFETRGYLRNVAGEKDPEILKALEHRSFLAKLDSALGRLSKVERLAYSDVLETHRILFESIYPWAGQDRAETAANIAVSRGAVLFAHPRGVKLAVDYALNRGQEKDFMASRPGEVMGYLAYGHPFLDGNGRTIMVVHTVLAQRAGISIDWSRTGKVEYLTALTQELDQPGQGHLDAYLKAFLGNAFDSGLLSSHLGGLQGLGGSTSSGRNEILGKLDDPAVQARYQVEEKQRVQSDPKYRATLE